MFKILIFSLLLLLSPSSFALGKLGHQVVCQLAYQNLSNENQHKINELLSSLTDKERQLINRYNYRDSKNKITFADTCTWADAIKKDDSYDQYKPWHYLNTTRAATKITQTTCTENCVSQAILIHTRQLATSKNLQKKVQALMFLGHWLGDIHQPLHVSYADDLGGNRRKITATQGQCNNLHWLWDSCLLGARLTKQTKQTKQNSSTVLLNKLSTQWKDAPIKQWQQDDVFQWASESLTLIREASFQYCKENGHGECQKIAAKVIHLPESYLVAYQPILEQRILQAAVRLNGLLSSAL